MSTYTHCFVNAPLTANVSVALADITTLIPILIPARTCINNLYFQNSTFTSTAGIPPIVVPAVATFTIGWTGNLNAIVSAAAGVTTTNLGVSDILYTPAGTRITNAAPQTLLVTPSADITAGTLSIIIETTSFATMP